MALGSKLYLLIVSFFILSLAQAQTNDDSLFIKKISDEILQNGHAYANLRELCKSIGHRLSGSVGMYKAEDWGIKTLKNSGADNAYKQPCMVPHWVRGGAAIAKFSSKKRSKNPEFSVAALGNSLSTKSGGIIAKIIEIKNYEELNKRKDEVRGKIVFYNYPYNKKMFGGAYGDAVRYRGGGASAASKYGALAVLVRSVTAANDDNPHTGALRYNDSFPKIPALAISTKDAEALSGFLKGNYKEDNFYLKSNAAMLPDTIAHNIIGEIIGTEFPNEIITIGGHLDSWDLGEGAHDDGTGIVQSIEVLRVLKTLGYKPKRTIRIVLFANEENGLRGGTRYMEEAKAKGETHLMAMESDLGGETPKGFTCGMTDEQFSKVTTWKKLFTLLEADKFSFSKGGGGGADIGLLQTAFKTAQFGFTTVGNRYFDYHHASTDVFENVHERELHLGAVVMAAMVYLVDKYGL